MSNYNLEARFPLREDSDLLENSLSESMWEIFVAVGKFWSDKVPVAPMKSNFLVFLSNRIKANPNYLGEYRNAADVMSELTAELGATEGIKKLLADSAANISPPTTRLARARQLVSNEFVVLFLALGGFKEFGDGAVELNHPGYFGGANLQNLAPYRTYKDKI